MEEAWRAKSVQLRRSRLADEGAVREAEQRMQGAQQRAAQRQRERQQRDAALQVQPLLDETPCLSALEVLVHGGNKLAATGSVYSKAHTKFSIRYVAVAGCMRLEHIMYRYGPTTGYVTECLCRRQQLSASGRKAQAAASAERAAFEAQEARMAALSWSSARSKSAGCLRRLLSAHGRLLSSAASACPSLQARYLLLESLSVLAAI